MSTSIEANRSLEGFLDIPIRLARIRDLNTSGPIERELDRIHAAWEWMDAERVRMANELVDCATKHRSKG